MRKICKTNIPKSAFCCLSIAVISQQKQLCTSAILQSTMTADPVTDCQVSEWASWSACRSSSEEVESKKEPFCGHGISSRHRRIVQLPKFGGLACPILEQQRSCFGVYEPHCQKLLSGT
ncbi:putative R-spondin-3, partial [Trichinella spiralis]|uniref:putative R-spondin-3 n=1 Tax=Trichinella spiralis TaxID=6334 RepID=UPI0001EFE612